MTKLLERKENNLEVIITLPIDWLSVLDHIENIIYCNSKLRELSQTIVNPVVGYIIERSQGIRHAHFRILPEESAENLRKKNPSFDYVTIQEILNRLSEIESGKYNVRDGIIISLKNQ